MNVFGRLLKRRPDNHAEVEAQLAAEEARVREQEKRLRQIRHVQREREFYLRQHRRTT